MYEVSNAYLEQMMRHGTRRRLSGTVGSVPFTGNDVVKESFNITGRASEESNTKIGGVYLSEVDITFVPSFLSKVSLSEFRDKEMTVKIGLWVPDISDEINGGEWVDVPVGVFTLQAPKISKQGITINGYDHLLKTDKKFTIDETSATPWGFLSYLATECGVELSQTQAEIEALPNGTEVMGLHEENDIETFRDFLYWLAQACGCFACADRFGRIALRRFGSPNSIEIDSEHRDDDVIFSGFVTKWTGISFVDIDTKMTRYYGLEVDDGLTMNMGANPLLQLGSPEAVTRRRTNVLNAVAQIQYTPFYANSARDPIFDLGDELNFIGGLSGNCTSVIMAYTFSLDNYRFEGYGDDPTLTNARSKTDKNISGLIQNTVENEVTYYNFANLEQIQFGSEQEVTIASLRFTSAQQTTVKIMHEFIMDMIRNLSIQGSYEIKYYYDEQLVNYSPYESLSPLVITTQIPEPEEIEENDTEPIQANIEPMEVSITRDFFYVLKDVQPNIRHTWQVKIIAHGIEQVTIDVNHAHVTLEGQRMFGDEYFDGFIEVKEPIVAEGVGNMGVVSIDDDVDVTFDLALRALGDDDFTLIDVCTIQPLNIEEETGVLAPHVYMEGGFFICAEDGTILCNQDGKRFTTE